MMENFIWALIVFGVPTVVAYLFTFRTENVVRWEARVYRGMYKDALQMSDEEIDRVSLSKMDRLMKGPVSRYVVSGVEYPERFRRRISFIKLVGYLIWGMLLVAMILLLCGLAGGTLVPTK